ncbi:CU044_2847 family protein [Microbacterium abyssi]|uniref:CU044_2847 family protein n=1 Tax=Microbacterium abyssi TaxID=2782166 RepID=UPI00188879A7|nr:CU044_2847 family protein [Microbacterium sp. A18JL241]
MGAENQNATEDTAVLIEVRPTNAEGRLISEDSTIERLTGRIDDVQRGVKAGVATLAKSLPELPTPDGWHLASVEATFGVSLGYEGSVIISSIAAEASFEVSVTFSPRLPSS